METKDLIRTDNYKGFLYGFKVYTNSWLTENKETVVRRTWWERLFKRPWTPWKSKKVVVETVPLQKAIMMGDSIFVHPAIYIEMAKEISEFKGNHDEYIYKW